MKREKLYNFRVSEEEMARFERVARHFGLSMAQMIRMLVKQEADAIVGWATGGSFH